jgi:hypothetical protein
VKVAYADGARQGAPDAQQISDRFHLLVNLQDGLKRLFERKHESLQQIAAAEQLPAEQTQEMLLLPTSDETKAAIEKEALSLSVAENMPLPLCLHDNLIFGLHQHDTLH